MQSATGLLTFLLGFSAMAYGADESALKCRNPAALRGQLNPAKPLIGIHLKGELPDPANSVRRIVEVYGLKIDQAHVDAIVNSQFFSDYFIYERPPPGLVAALRCDPDISLIDYDGML
jgi:hypothetical protein